MRLIVTNGPLQQSSSRDQRRESEKVAEASVGGDHRGAESQCAGIYERVRGFVASGLLLHVRRSVGVEFWLVRV